MKQEKTNNMEIEDSILIIKPKHKNFVFPNYKILSVKLTKEYTRIDFEFYKNRDGIRIKDFVIGPHVQLITRRIPEIFKSEKAYKLVKSENAPIYPEIQKTIGYNRVHYFTLFFEPLDLDTKIFDLIEEELEDFENENEDMYMNFYGIELRKGQMKLDKLNIPN